MKIHKTQKHTANSVCAFCKQRGGQDHATSGQSNYHMYYNQLCQAFHPDAEPSCNCKRPHDQQSSNLGSSYLSQQEEYLALSQALFLLCNVSHRSLENTVVHQPLTVGKLDSLICNSPVRKGFSEYAT